MFQPSLFESEPYIRTVSEINAYIRQKLDADANLQDVWLEGEISNWKQATSGHIYFTLKDSRSSIRCVIWRSQAAQLRYTPQQDGEAVLAHGRISVYEAGGNYQFYVDDLEPIGQGALYIQFERIKAQLAAEGMFDPDRKQPVPEMPQNIGIVTSADAAALRDILNVLRRRYPIAQIIVSPTPVQGETAPGQIVAALKAIARQPVDVIILARGGGSLEDLWAFNHETVARAIAACPIPVVSGIGHETDFTIADFVADVRAPTPSAAAELVSPDRLEIKRQLADYQQTAIELLRQRISGGREQVERQNWALKRVSPHAQINNYRQRVDGLTANARRAIDHQLVVQRQRLDNLDGRLTALSPLSTLDRGYAIIQHGATVITQAAQVAPGDEITAKFKDDDLEATVRKVRARQRQ
jgi:exodeoxyribonuclease VII large subunit